MTSVPLKYGLKPDVLKSLLDIILTVPQVTEIILFGSRAKGNFKQGSDIDICIKGVNITQQDVKTLLCKIDKLDLPWEIDLLSYDSISDLAVKEHIDRVGIKLF
jgi:predicted nucleotidyltransferase